MDISKYLTNKDIQLSNEDINLEKLEKDIRKGYVLESEQESAIKNALETSKKESTSKYAELETKYKNMYAIGDGAGVTRGLAQAAATGVYVARNILKRI